MIEKYAPPIIAIALILCIGIGGFWLIESLEKRINESESKRKAFSTAEPTYLKLVTLDNGMPCVKYIKRGGLTCDWGFKTRGKL